MITATGIVSDEKFLERENEYLKKMMGVCKNLGIKYSDTLSIKSGKYFATQVFHSDMRKYPENEKQFSKEVWESINAFYRTCVTSEKSPFFLDKTKDYGTVQKVTSLIRNAGGKSFLAHLYGYYLDNPDEYLNSITSLNELDGIECYHSLHSMDKTNFLIDYCNRHKLYVSGGSDYHGKIKPAVKIGESIAGVKIPYAIAKPWLSSYII
jgi:hypothetical protein